MSLLATVNWEKWVAIGTLSLAAATFLLALIGGYAALLTRRLASAAQRTAAAEVRALENSVRPLLLSVPQVEIRAESGAVSVPVRNAGVGPAVVATPHPWIQVTTSSAVTQGRATEGVVPVGEQTHLEFNPEPGADLSRFYVQVAYTDADGGQLRRTELYVTRDENGFYGARGFAIYRGADGDLIVASGRGWDVSLGRREWS